MGPVERQLRDRLRRGEVLSRSAAIAAHGPIAAVLLDGFVRRGAATREGDRYAPVIRVIPEETIESVNAKLREMVTPSAASLEAADKRRAQREALRTALAAAATPAERERVMRESRLLAHAEDAIANLADVEIDGSLFGIEMEGA